MRGKPFPNSWQNILDEKVPYYQKLPEKYQEILRQRVMVFINEKLFEGCGGLRMTDQKKVIISAYACVLLLEETSDYYPDLQTILVYPDDYIAPVHEEDETGIVTTGSEARKGESWNTGSIVLSWSDIEDNIYDENKKQNLIFHEFAHQLDQRYGLTAGITLEGNVIQKNEWNNILATSYKELCRKVKRNENSVLDEYGATEPAEFFSVATEAFFENPIKLKQEYKNLYKQLFSFYKIDPVDFGK
ncbi:MAG: M90 family metallopeptidase [Balneolaceae bacterium]